MSVIWNNEAFKRIKVLSLPEDKTIYGLFVEGGTKIPEVNVVYNDALSASLVGGDTATLPVASKKMKTDIKIAVPESAFSPLPIEVATEAEMTALLESGEVGGVYKYTGTTGTYENGALYVLEASVVKISLEVNSSDEGIFNFPVPSGATTWSDMNGVVDETSQYVITTTIDTSDADVPKICRAGDIVDSFYGLVKNNINTDLVRVSDTLDYDNTYYSFVNTHGVGGGGSN